MAARIGALEAGGTKMVLAVGTADGHIEEQVSMPTVEPERVVPEMAQWFADKKVDAIGIGAFGPTVVNPNNPDFGKICFTPKPGWSYYDFLGNMKAGCDVPMGYDTDVNVACLGEATFGCAKGLDSVCYFTVGTGIGAGVMVGGQLLRGAHSFAGEFSFVRHTPILGEFRSRDAMSGLCSWQGLRRSILAAKGLEDDEHIDGLQLFDWVNSGDEAALRGLHAYAKDLCTWIFNLQCIVDPDVVTIGGGISVQPALLEALHISMRSMMADQSM